MALTELSVPLSEGLMMSFFVMLFVLRVALIPALAMATNLCSVTPLHGFSYRGDPTGRVAAPVWENIHMVTHIYR